MIIIFTEWAKKETVTVEKVHRVLMKSECIRAAGCLSSAAHVLSTMSQEDDGILDLGSEPYLDLEQSEHSATRKHPSFFIDKGECIGAV